MPLKSIKRWKGKEGQFLPNMSPTTHRATADLTFHDGPEYKTILTAPLNRRRLGIYSTHEHCCFLRIINYTTEPVVGHVLPINRKSQQIHRKYATLAYPQSVCICSCTGSCFICAASGNLLLSPCALYSMSLRSQTHTSSQSQWPDMETFKEDLHSPKYFFFRTF